MNAFRRCFLHIGAVSFTFLSLWTSLARADFNTDFEAPNYTAALALNNQDGWYLPDSGGTSYDVLSYAGNTLGLPNNPTGGSQFAGLSGPGSSFGRSQHNVDFSIAPIWRMSYDVCHAFNGTLPATQNLASFSTQVAPTAAHRSIIALHTWSDINSATSWNASFNVFDAAGTSTPMLSPGSAWNNLLLNNWYRESFTFDLSTNEVLSVSLTDLSTNVTNTFLPTGWYLNGGSSGGGLPLPSAIRLFTGGTVAGNISGWDNISVTSIPEPGTLALLSVGVLGLLSRRRRSIAAI